MILADVSVLVAAVRVDHIHHAQAHAALSRAFTARQPVAWSGQLLAGMVRIITNRKIFPDPTPTAAAFAAADGFIGYPQAKRIEPGSDHWRIYRDLALHLDLRGGDLSDAWHAALAIEHGCQWWTLDRDFARFPGLKTTNLLVDG